MITDELILESKVNEVYYCTVPVKSLPIQVFLEFLQLIVLATITKEHLGCFPTFLSLTKFFSQAFFEEINSLEGEVKKVAKDGRDLIQTYNINGHVEEDITKDIDEIQERYDELKNRSIEEIKRYDSTGFLFCCLC